MNWALAQYVILGLTTNLPFLRDVLHHPDFIAGDVTTRFVDDQFAAWVENRPDELPDAALIAAAFSELHGLALDLPNEGTAGSDLYTPWARGDSFRLGG